ncbi:MAG: sterol desaturase family protein [Sinomicrobium sp.]|nr:sterol desaturase family protein [Sinomicrobium sp.]
METLNKLLSIDSNYISIGFVLLFFTLEQFITTQFRFIDRTKHLLNNVVLMLAFILLNLLFATLIVKSFEWLNDHKIGLFYILEIPAIPKMILAVFLFDFISYWFHRLGHFSPFLWRLHRVHHSDTTMDSSTQFRGHPIDALYYTFSDIVTCALFGLTLTECGVYFLVLSPFLAWTHSNLKVPKWVDKSIGIFMTTPHFHRVHHEQDQFYTDSNFSDIFIMWDKIFGTFKYKEPESINFGLTEFDSNKKQSPWFLLISPFINIKKIKSTEE